MRNWEQFQHYKDRQPVWIKLHVQLLDDLEMRRSCSTTTRLVWPHILLLAARFNNRLESDPKWFENALGIKPKEAQIAIRELRKGRWLVGSRASKTLADRYQNASLEKRREDKPKTTPTNPTSREDPRPPDGWATIIPWEVPA